jgi:sugar phosphate isomerase/epimerase
VRVINANGMRVTGYCRGGMFPAADGAGRQAAVNDNMHAIDEAAALEAECLVLVVAGLPPGSRGSTGARAMVADGLSAILPHARACQVPLAIEPLHPMYAGDRACVNTLSQALDLAQGLGEGVGVCNRRISRMMGSAARGADRARWPLEKNTCLSYL